MANWNPDPYKRYRLYRDRPALDLLLQLPGDLKPRVIWDLGCGEGEITALLALRHSAASVHGLEAREDRLARARPRSQQVYWHLGDITDFAPSSPVDLIVSNEALQTHGDHEHLLPRLVQTLAPGGCLACQMPQTLQSPQHQLLLQVASTGPWSARMTAAGLVQPTPDMALYHSWLAPLCQAVDIWKTTYLHVLDGPDPVLDWMMGETLRPCLDALPDGDEQETFLEALARALEAAFPPQPDGTTLLPLERLFLVARKSG